MSLAETLLFDRRLWRLVHAPLRPSLTAASVHLAFVWSTSWTVAAIVGFVAGPSLCWMTYGILFRGIEKPQTRDGIPGT